MNEIPINTFFTTLLLVIRQLHMYEIDAVQLIFIAVDLGPQTTPSMPFHRHYFSFSWVIKQQWDILYLTRTEVSFFNWAEVCVLRRIPFSTSTIPSSMSYLCLFLFVDQISWLNIEVKLFDLHWNIHINLVTYEKLMTTEVECFQYSLHCSNLGEVLASLILIVSRFMGDNTVVSRSRHQLQLQVSVNIW